ncbi:DnaJ domain-containing protein, partial [Syncephalis pseudoplumigaleata]
RQQGNERFKTGHFAEAEALYTQAIDCLPSDHARNVLLYNNRAAARLKGANYRAAIGDCGVAITMIGGETNSTQDGVVFKDQLCKALLRRATARQALEQFDEAIRDYERAASHGAGVAATEGARQCRQSKVGASKAQPPPPPSSATPTNNNNNSSSSSSSTSEHIEKSTAVAEMRRKEMQAKEEEQKRLAIKDQVEARVNRWRFQKEDNLRGLLCSLDSILWPEAGVKQCGLQDLISPSQVKVRYMRAIARLHPDKVAKDASIEQRLVAQEVFVSLNRAWDAFRVQNNM